MSIVPQNLFRVSHTNCFSLLTKIEKKINQCDKLSLKPITYIFNGIQWFSSVLPLNMKLLYSKMILIRQFCMKFIDFGGGGGGAVCHSDS